MARAILAVFLYAVLTCLPQEGSGHEQNRTGFLSVLNEGQRVVLEAADGHYQITLIDGGHKVIEVGSDYVVVQDLVEITETRIPVYSIKSIARLRVPKP